MSTQVLVAPDSVNVCEGGSIVVADGAGLVDITLCTGPVPSVGAVLAVVNAQPGATVVVAHADFCVTVALGTEARFCHNAVTWVPLVPLAKQDVQGGGDDAEPSVHEAQPEPNPEPVSEPAKTGRAKSVPAKSVPAKSAQAKSAPAKSLMQATGMPRAAGRAPVRKAARPAPVPSRGACGSYLKLAAASALVHKQVSFTAADIARLYNFPTGTGAGCTVAIVQLGGGYTPADQAAYYKALGVASPPVRVLAVDGGRNNPRDTDASVEVALDMQVIGAVAPAATQVVVFAPNSFRSFCNAVAAAAAAAPIVSISWGAPEEAWPVAERSRMNAILAAAAARGVNVFVASGDNGSSDGMGPPDSTHADFPASSPHVIACGGTTLVSDGIAIASETVWNASGGAAGGAFSKVFSKLPHQAQVPGGKRGVPDVCGCADPATGYSIVVAGRRMVVGGTSAVAPLYAGLAARLQAAGRGRLPPLGPVLYASKEAAVVDITTGSNGAYMAAKGWDAASGLGRIVGSGLQAALGV